MLIYHDATKHHPHRYARSLGYLDWANQPDPFRRFDGAPRVELVVGARDREPAYDNLFSPGAIPSEPVNRRTISEFLECSLGISAWKSYKTSTWALRCNPSSGNLHPTESYLICGAAEGIGDRPGIYHYVSQDHVLELRHAFDGELWKSLAPLASDRCFFVGLSSVFWREAWKYGERAFRYCQHDVGHALAALRFAAAMLGWRMRLVEIGDEDLARLLGLEQVNAGPRVEWEHAEALVVVTTNGDGAVLNIGELPRAWPTPCGVGSDPVSPKSAEAWPTPCGVGSDRASLNSESRSSPSTGSAPQFSVAADSVEQVACGPWHGTPNRLSDEHVEWDIIDMVADATVRESETGDEKSGAAHRLSAGTTRSSDSATGPSASATRLQADAPNGAHFSTGATDATARQVILRRRSATDFDGETRLGRDDFFRMLRRVSPSASGGAPPWDMIAWSPRIHLLMFVHLVDGLRPGLYAFVRDSAKVDALRAATKPDFEWTRPADCPSGLDLFFLMEADCRRAAAQLSLGQAIGGTSAFSFGMIAEFEASLKEFGPWFYRRLFWEAGMVGQTLYLEAEAAAIRAGNTLRATGIGAYFDDLVHDVFGLTGHAFCDLYHFTIGGAVEDTRLTTRPPYDESITRRK